eukprot:gnl/Dysnectes_brevis/3771_a4846_763.p1 GENE.gnl/Dysnectes_brevis/3771_a4846_763~~gnl/Dysnectes_brevis/3771_a4846_763.p1  ORF type:complete len:212 (-),score=30.94 gnl/Dysnectes_brevis/3771_a4846_763:79-714(-)
MIFNVGKLLSRDYYTTLYAQPEFLQRAASDVGLIALAFVAVSHRSALPAVRTRSASKLDELRMLASKAAQEVEPHSAILVAPTLRQLNYAIRSRSMWTIRNLINLEAEQVLRHSWPGLEADQSLSAAEAQLNAVSKAYAKCRRFEQAERMFSPALLQRLGAELRGRFLYMEQRKQALRYCSDFEKKFMSSIFRTEEVNAIWDRHIKLITDL